jgi:hypothetical protein
MEPSPLLGYRQQKKTDTQWKGKRARRSRYTLDAIRNDRTWIAWACALYFLGTGMTLPAKAESFYVDATKGSDTNRGTAQAPFQSIQRAMEGIPGGSTIFLQPGKYAAIEHKAKVGVAVVEGEMVTIQPAPDVADPLKEVSIARIQIGSRAGVFAGPDAKGTYDVNLRIEKVNILDGVYLYGGRNLQLVGCLVERIGPWTGSAENIEKVGVELGGCSEVLIEGCEVTRTGTGLYLSGSNVRALRNRIHDIRHDGIRIVSLKDSLVEGNEIFNLDDGVEDADAKWSRHCDGIHIFIPGPGVPGAQNSRVTVRGNRIYNCESQGIQFNNYLRNKELWNEDITIENNIFGPTRANAVNIADPVDGIIFRHNTFVSFPESRTFRGEGRDVECNNSVFRISTPCKRAQVYNNILTHAFESAPGWFVGHNVIVTAKLAGLPTRNDVVVADVQFTDAATFDGRVAAGSPVVNVGTRLAPAPAWEEDAYGTKRDARPDAGAYEVPGLTPAAESPMPVLKEPVRFHVDDFRDANVDEDPWLAGDGQRGLSWKAPADQTQAWKPKAMTDAEGNIQAILSPQGIKGDSWVIASNVGEWADGKVSLTVSNAFNTGGSGVLLRGNADTEGYLIDYARGGIYLRSKTKDGPLEETSLAEGLPTLPRTGIVSYVVSIEDTAQGVKITASLDDKDAKPIVAWDKSKRLARGHMALFNRSHNGSHRTDIMAIKLEVLRP